MRDGPGAGVGRDSAILTEAGQIILNPAHEFQVDQELIQRCIANALADPQGGAVDLIGATLPYGTLAVNVIGAFQMVRAFEALLRRHPPSAVVNMSSVASTTGLGSSVAYVASKGALNAMTVALARALGPEIRLNGIAPGLVDTRWLQNGMGAERYAAGVAAYKARSALAEIVQPEDVARAAWYLGVDALKTTGEVLAVDAGVKLLPV